MKRQRSLTTLFTFLKEFEMNVNPHGWENRWMNDWSSWYNVNVSVMLNSSIVQSLVMHFWVSAQVTFILHWKEAFFTLCASTMSGHRFNNMKYFNYIWSCERGDKTALFLHPEHQLYVDALTFAAFLHLFISRNGQHIMHSPTEDMCTHKQRQTKKTLQSHNYPRTKCICF